MQRLLQCLNKVEAGSVVSLWDNVRPISEAISNDEVIMTAIATEVCTTLLKWLSWSVLAHKWFSRDGGKKISEFFA